MARVLAEAVRDRQRLLPAPVRLDVNGASIELRPADVRAAHERARRSGKPHNAARVTFVRQLLGVLADRLGAIPGLRLPADDRAALIAELRESQDVRREVNGCWPPLSPERLLRDLYADPARLAAAAPGAVRPGPGPAGPGPPGPVDAGGRAAARRGRRAARPGRRPGRHGRGGGGPAGRGRVRPAGAAGLAGRRPGHRRGPGRPVVGRPGAAAPSPSARPGTGSGPSATSWWTRRRSCPRWPGGC